MVWTREPDAPLSVILPRLYLGAERDVTQDRLASLGISHVLSVSRCSPQPSFLPDSRYFRVPIDDSLWDDLLPWIPQALRFIDAAILSGGSVLVHCAAGISRSPALAVAYIMYSLEMDLDSAYRFVKERRPAISPNFNFLGQLQLFHSTLQRKPRGGDSCDAQLDGRWPAQSHVSAHAEDSQQTHEGGRGKTQEIRTLDLSLCRNQLRKQNQRHVPASGHCRPGAPKPAALQVQTPAALLEKRKRLSLSLTSQGSCVSPSATASLQPGEAAGLEQSAPCREKSSNWREKEKGLLSPFSFTLNKLLDWGERLLFSGVFVHPVKTGQPALTYKC